MSRTLGQLQRLPVTELKGVGPEKAKALERLGHHTVLDLLTYYPRRYIDRTKEARLADLRVGEEASVLVEVKRVTSRPPRSGRGRAMVDRRGRRRHRAARASRSSTSRGGPSSCGPASRRSCSASSRCSGARRQMTNPVVDLVGDRTGKIIPVYPQSDKERIYTWEVARWQEEVLEPGG